MTGCSACCFLFGLLFTEDRDSTFLWNVSVLPDYSVAYQKTVFLTVTSSDKTSRLHTNSYWLKTALKWMLKIATIFKLLHVSMAAFWKRPEHVVYTVDTAAEAYADRYSISNETPVDDSRRVMVVVFNFVQQHCIRICILRYDINKHKQTSFW